MKKYLKLPLYIFISFLKIDWVEHLNIFSTFNSIIKFLKLKNILSSWLDAKIVVKNSSFENILQILAFLLLQLSLFLSFYSVFSFFSSSVSFSFICNTKIQNKTSVHWIFWKIQYSLWKPIDSHWLKNVLLALFSLQLCLFFFHKMIKFYRNLFCMNEPCFCRKYFLTDWRHRCCKNTIEISSICWNVLLQIFSNWIRIIITKNYFS